MCVQFYLVCFRLRAFCHSLLPAAVLLMMTTMRTFASADTLDDRVRVLRAGRDPVKNVLEQDSGIKKDPASIKALAKEYILPHIDFLTLSQWVLGTYWREAAPEQPQTFMAEFQELLLRTYGVALAESSDQHLEFLFLRAGAVSNPVTVDARFE
jgi:ABC-type transporter MlaC component